MTIWKQIAVCFYQNEIADGMDLFMANVAKLGTNRSAAPLINPIFDAIERQIIHMQRIFCTMKYRVNKKIKRKIKKI